ncbi:MAG: PKD domain-containing protein [Bacteroidia bacterium]|nr:PKD domain-containing protein [Bacteroidia bacterium]
MKTTLCNVFLMLLLAVFFSCKKQDPVVTQNQPVFYLSGSVDGVPLDIKAGVNNYYMYSSYTHDTNDVYNFKGEFKTHNCSGVCPNSFEVTINDFQSQLPGTPAQISTSLIPGYYAIQNVSGTPTQFITSFAESVTPGVQTLSWNFGDGGTSSASNPSHTYTHPGIYDVCMVATFTNSCTSTICQKIKVEAPGNTLVSPIASNPPTGNTIQFNTISSFGAAPYVYYWDFGDGVTSAQQNPQHTYAVAGVYNVYLKVTDAGSGISEANRNVSTQGFTGCNSNFNFSTAAGATNSYGFSNVSIVYTDAAGLSWSSISASPNNGDYFRILSVDNYGTNENSQPVKKIKAAFKMRVYNGANFKDIVSNESVFAVSYF